MDYSYLAEFDDELQKRLGQPMTFTEGMSFVKDFVASKAGLDFSDGSFPVNGDSLSSFHQWLAGNLRPENWSRAEFPIRSYVLQLATLADDEGNCYYQIDMSGQPWGKLESADRDRRACSATNREWIGDDLRRFAVFLQNLPDGYNKSVAEFAIGLGFLAFACKEHLESCPPLPHPRIPMFVGWCDGNFFEIPTAT